MTAKATALEFHFVPLNLSLRFYISIDLCSWNKPWKMSSTNPLFTLNATTYGKFTDNRSPPLPLLSCCAWLRLKMLGISLCSRWTCHPIPFPSQEHSGREMWVHGVRSLLQQPKSNNPHPSFLGWLPSSYRQLWEGVRGPPGPVWLLGQEVLGRLQHQWLEIHQQAPPRLHLLQMLIKHTHSNPAFWTCPVPQHNRLQHFHHTQRQIASPRPSGSVIFMQR